MSDIAANLAAVRGRLEQAARTAGRNPSDIRLVAISKTFPPAAVRAAFDAGQVDFGENRVQEALQKIRETAELHTRWHLVGHLQTNKARKVAGTFAYIHSIDSLDLLRMVDEAAAAQAATPNLLIQVDSAGETTKFGAHESDLPALFEAAGQLRAASVVGLMLLPPVLGGSGRRQAVVHTAARHPGHAGRLGRAGRTPPGAVDGHEPRLPRRRGGRGHHRESGNGHFRRPYVGGRNFSSAGLSGGTSVPPVWNSELNMKVTPLDLRQQKFKTVMRGYDRAEVEAFLAETAEDYEQALRDADRLRDDLTRLQSSLDEHREGERNLRNTLLTAQKLADEIRNSAEAEAKRILREAEGRADLTLSKAQGRVDEVQREIDGLRLKRRDVESSLESTIAALRNSLEFVREQDQKEREDKILLHRPRVAESLPGIPARVLEELKVAEG